MATENQPDNKPNFPTMEETVLRFWEKEDIFQKTLQKTKDGKRFVFFEGPPTANGKPGIHHVLARAFKDIICRFKTMQGFLVERKAGWDTHGLPVELQVEKELKISGKPQIENIMPGDPMASITAFNQKCKASVWKYKEDWEKMTRRIGFWLDLEHPYITYETNYIESLWWIIKQIWDKDLLYKGHKVVPHCPRCGTALSSHEVAQGYASVTENSVYVKFLVTNPEQVMPEVKDDLFILSWTTTPWTLPGNVALAVGEKIDYVAVEQDGETYILAKEAVSRLEGKYKIEKEFKGKDLVGLEYAPLYAIKPLQTETSHQVYTADFVTTGDGTGVVHTAVMYGEDDYNLGEKVGLPKHHTVDESGKFTKEVTKWAGKFVKDKEVEKGIVNDLRERELLYKEEMYTHDYPFCWRCDTPLLYYAKDSWFIRMSQLKQQLIKNNEAINWFPGYIKQGRFGEWLNELKDWAFSRERYWGTPLPIWECEKCDKRTVIGSLDELVDKSGARDELRRTQTVFLLRHGESTKNKTHTHHSILEQDVYPLTPAGKKQIEEVARTLSGKIDIIVTSDFKRTRESAEIVAKVTHAPIAVDHRLGEYFLPTYEGQLVTKVREDFPNRKIQLHSAPSGGETLLDVTQRMQQAVTDALGRYKNKRILFVSHGDPIWMLQWKRSGKSEEELESFPYPKKATLHELTMEAPIDLHRPFVDDITFTCECGGKMKRVKEVVDVWFDSGAMPFAQWHYPFENKERIDSNVSFPAEYIAEAMDQTRGWFYTLLAISTLLGKGAPYRNVVCLGLIMDSQGQKMSKSRGNVIDPSAMIEKYGADAVRWHLFTMNQPGDTKLFDEKNLEDVVKKNWLILWNILSFWNMYAREFKPGPQPIQHILDKWIVARLNKLIKKVTQHLGQYQITGAGRAISEFIAELSTWYLRRSRGRFKKEGPDKQQALATLHFVLLQLAKLLAPFAPFIADSLYQQLKGGEVSVHLADWPQVEPKTIDQNLLKQMDIVRQAVELGHSLRKERQLKVRQPLAQFVIVTAALDQAFTALIREEINVQEVIVVKQLPTGKEFVGKENGSLKVALDTTITDELKQQGFIRDVVRQINAMRKDAKLTINDTITVYYDIPDEELAGIFLHYKADICRDVLAVDCLKGLPDNVDLKKVLDISGRKFVLAIKKR